MAAAAARRWLGLVTAVWVQCISGNNYAFANYSGALKSLMGLTQTQLNALSVVKDAGKAFGLLAGAASDRGLPPAALLLVGSLLGLIGYGAQYLVVAGTVSPPPPFWQMCVLLCIAGNSTTWMNTAVLVTCIRNFPSDRGPVSGILKGYVGLSTAIFTDLCSALFAGGADQSAAAAFLLVLAVVPAAVCSSAMLFLREEEEDQEALISSRSFNVLSSIATVIAIYLLAFDVSGPHEKLVSRFFAAGLFVLILLPLAIPAYLFFIRRRPSCSSGDTDLKPPLLLRDTEETKFAEEDQRRRIPAIGEDHTVGEAARTVEFWLMFAGFLCGVGTGLAVMNNLGQISQAMGFADASVFVSIFSVSGFFGRIATGALSEKFIAERATPRSVWNAASMVLMAAGFAAMAAAAPGSLHAGAAVVGACYGVRLAVTVPMASEMFGLRNYGIMYNVIVLNLPIGSFVFSGLLAGLLYDAQASPAAGGGGGNACVGAHCFRLVFVVMCVACVVGLGLDVILAVRTKGIYVKIRASKRRKSSSCNNPSIKRQIILG